MPGVSVHVVDVVAGAPAVGMAVTLSGCDAAGGRRIIGSGTIGADGQFRDASNAMRLVRGAHEVELHAGDYYRHAGLVREGQAFQDVVVFRFTVTDPEEHYHLPFKLSPWGLSVWRGR